MRLKGIFLTMLVLAALTAVSGSVSFKPVFDLSQWSLDTYPAFVHGAPGTLYNAKTTQLPSVYSGSIPDVKYSPMFDMSPGAWSFNTYPKYTGSSAGQGTIFGMMTGTIGRSTI